MMVRIVPTILTKSFPEFKERLGKLSRVFTLVQIDCGDGKFVGNQTFYNASDVNMVIKVNYELHLMVKEPFKEIKKWVKYKKLKNVIFHYEAVRSDNNILQIIDFLHKKGIRAGLAINLETKVEKVIKILPKVDVLLVMGVNPGWGGQKIKLNMVKSKVSKVRKLYPELDIEIDGGVNLKNVGELVKSGANILAMGRALSAVVDYRQIIAGLNKNNKF